MLKEKISNSTVGSGALIIAAVIGAMSSLFGTPVLALLTMPFAYVGLTLLSGKTFESSKKSEPIPPIKRYDTKLQELLAALQQPENECQFLQPTLNIVTFESDNKPAVSTGFFEAIYNKDKKRYLFKFYLRPADEEGMVNVDEMTSLFKVDGGNPWPGYHGDEPTEEDNHWRYSLHKFEWSKSVPVSEAMKTIHDVLVKRSTGTLNNVNYVPGLRFHSDAPVGR